MNISKAQYRYLIDDLISENKALVEALVEKQEHDQMKGNTVRLAKAVSTQFLINKTVPAYAIPDVEWHAFLDEYQSDPATHNNYMVVLNKLRASCGMPRLERGYIKIKPRGKLSLPKTDNDYAKLISVVDNDRDRVILGTLRYGGLRAGELVSLRVENFEVHDDYVVIRFYRGKTNVQAEVVVIEPAPEIGRYLDRLGGKPSDAVFFSNAYNHPREPLTYQGVWKMVRRWCVKASVKFHPHMFRHYRATELAKQNLTKWDLDNMFGWQGKSNTASVYVNLDNDETMSKIKGLKGLPVDNVEPVIMHCPRCATIIPKENTRCPRCYLPANSADALKEIEKDRVEEKSAKKEDVSALSVMLVEMQKEILELKQQVAQQKKE
jgi:integrase